MEVFKWMKAAGLQPDTFTYSSLISVCEKSGQWEKALDIFGWMSMAKVKANVVTYGSLIAACEKGGQWELALEVFQEMHNSGVQANASTFNTLICACEKGGQWRQALEVGTWMDSTCPFLPFLGSICERSLLASVTATIRSSSARPPRLGADKRSLTSRAAMLAVPLRCVYQQHHCSAQLQRQRHGQQPPLTAGSVARTQMLTRRWRRTW
jgi:pentatricopeptide repeat protein